MEILNLFYIKIAIFLRFFYCKLDGLLDAKHVTIPGQSVV